MHKDSQSDLNRLDAPRFRKNMRPGGAFRFVFVTSRFDESRSFYRDGLGLEEESSWDGGPGERGVQMRAGRGFVELIERPEDGDIPQISVAPPAGASMAIEVPDAETFYGRVRDQGLPIHYPLTAFPCSELGFSVRDPDGIVVFLFSPIRLARRSSS